jgi:hypothetical protein
MIYIYYIEELNELFEYPSNDVVWFVDFTNNYNLLKPVLIGKL